MKKNIILIVVLVLIVGVVAGYTLKGSMENANQGASVSLTTKTDTATVSKAFDSVNSTLQRIGAANVYRFDPSKITSSVDLNKVDEETEPFTMRFPKTTIDDTIISPMLEPINCGTLPGGSTTHCCDTNSNTLTITNPRTGVVMTMPNGCTNGEWDRFQ